MLEAYSISSPQSNQAKRYPGQASGAFTQPTFHCNLSDQRWLRHPNRTETAWAQGCKDHNGLHPCAESGTEGRAEPDGRGLGGVIY